MPTKLAFEDRAIKGELIDTKRAVREGSFLWERKIKQF